MSVGGSINFNYPVPIGAIFPFLSNNIPAGFLLCDGTEYDNADYPDLARCLGGLYGGTATTFLLPDLANGFFISGTAVNNGDIVLPSTTGTFSATLAETNMPSLNLSSSGYTASGVCGFSCITTTGNITCNNEGSGIEQTYIPYQSSATTQPNFTVGISGISARYVGTSTPITGSFTGSVEPANYELVYIIKALV
jgi:microcystin-dependent protein